MHDTLATSHAPTTIVCRACGSAALFPLFSLGNLCLCNAFMVRGEEAPRSPLEVLICDIREGGCGLVQLRHSVPAALMYSRYWYRSGLSPTMRRHLEQLVRQAEDLVGLQPDDVVLDIGCNDGTALRAYREPQLRRIGFEPSQLQAEARVGTSTIIGELFSAEAFAAELGSRKARVVTSLAMFYDLDDPGRFVDSARACLAPDGIWVIEMHHLGAMVRHCGFDAIVHEHVAYYSLRVLQRLLMQRGLEAFDVVQNPMNGGSFRIFVRHRNASPAAPPGAAERLREFGEAEGAMRLESVETYRKWWRRVLIQKHRGVAFVSEAVARGKRVLVYGASTKGNSLLQFYGLDHRLIAAAVDINSDKWGLSTPGTAIPIIAPQAATREQPDYFLVLIWHLLDEVCEQWKDYLESGGRFLLPLPRFRLHGSAPAGRVAV